MVSGRVRMLGVQMASRFLEYSHSSVVVVVPDRLYKV